MNPRRSLRLPIILAIVMITLLTVLTVGWVLVNVFGALKAGSFAGWYWVLLTVGTTFIAVLLAGVILYLILSVKAINLNRAQSNFIDSVTHELKTPIASMKLYLQTLRRRQVSDAERADFYRVILEDVERLDHLINHVLEAGRVEVGASAGDIESVALPQLLQQCAAAVCTSYRLPPDAIQFRLAPCTLWARRGDLTIIFRNVIDNAVKYAGAELDVRVESRPAPHGRVVVRIADNGRGIPPRMRRKVFGRFVRLGMELEREKPGTGLGLHIVLTLVRRLRGRVRIRDREPGPGTVFEIELPVGTPPAHPAAEQNGTQP